MPLSPNKALPEEHLSFGIAQRSESCNLLTYVALGEHDQCSLTLFNDLATDISMRIYKVSRSPGRDSLAVECHVILLLRRTCHVF